QNPTAASHCVTIVGWLAILVFVCHACTHMVGASGTWLALTAGRHYLNHGVGTADPFSGNSRKAGPTESDIQDWPTSAQWIARKVSPDTLKRWHPTGWINQNWLTGVFFYWLTHRSPFADARTLSFNSLVFCKFAIYMLTAVCVYYAARFRGVHPGLSAAFACFAMFIGRSFFAIRGADFTNLLVAVFLLILGLTTYRNALYIWLAVPLAVLWSNLHGGYIYLFIMLVPFVVINLLTNFFPKHFVSVGLKGIYHTIAAGLVAFPATILFSPFHLTNVTHPFAITIGKHAEKWRGPNEWHPAFEWRNPVGDEIPFLIMLIIAGFLLLIWMLVLVVTRSSTRPCDHQQQENTQEYQWPKIDAASTILAALTIYMAVRFRRFIPIAAIATCPIMAMFIDQTIRAVCARQNFRRENRLFVGPMPNRLTLLFALAGVIGVLFFGSWWGLRFKRVYIDPWPTDPKLSSVFMRLTASDAKPFYACSFIKENNLKGNVFSYWTEGPFIALHQEPDPNTGCPPLQVFMDGRAQTAYDLQWQDRCMEIMAGGPAAREAKRDKRKLTDADYTEIGRWVDEQLKKYDVSVVLMPSYKSRTAFVKSLERHSDWQLVFFNDKHKLFVDITTTQGKELRDGIFSGKTLYCDDFHKSLIMAHSLLRSQAPPTEREKGLDFAVAAFELNPSGAPMQEILSAAKFAELKPRVNDFCRTWFDDFTQNKDVWA
ncbi:MAG: hypothetical protein ACYS21_16325, partial [Planctomycetota bacterium]